MIMFNFRSKKKRYFLFRICSVKDGKIVNTQFQIITMSDVRLKKEEKEEFTPQLTYLHMSKVIYIGVTLKIKKNLVFLCPGHLRAWVPLEFPKCLCYSWEAPRTTH